MRTTIAALMCTLAITLLSPVSQAISGGGEGTEPALNNIDAVKAMEIANEWKWLRKDVKSYVTSREVVFEFPDGDTRKVPLPADRMVVAVAPFVNRTHR